MRPAIGLPLKARARRQLSIKLRNICLPRPGTRAFRALRPSLRGYGVRIRLSIAMLQRSKTALVRRFTAYQEALVHEERVRQILRLPIEKAKRPCPETTDFSKPDTASAVTGFYTIETSAGREFRWSETAAVAEVRVPAGKVRLRLNCLTVPRRSKGKVIFFFNGKPVPQRKEKVWGNEIELRGQVPEGRRVASVVDLRAAYRAWNTVVSVCPSSVSASSNAWSRTSLPG
jgi:hypothetical protein